ncbi:MULTISPECIES: hypothetical protein [unclassified Streptomyces]|uniref:hypothetical protein n=1 Tax=unclassified Streptomyces TaxID=2593676 RepID=UPI0022382C06|nr:hypothetical protein [Streptomyces sp. SHP 1-2]
MKVRRTGTAIAVLPCLVLLGVSALAGCGPDEGAELGSGQLTGVWQGTGGGTVRFGADGRFEMSGIPRSAVVFSFSDPPPGDGRLSGAGEWELAGGDGTSGTIELGFDAGGSFADDSEATVLQVKEAGDRPVLYFDTDADEAYGYEVRRVTSG